MNMITSKDNSIIKYYTKLSLSKKERKETESFVLEGARLCLDAIKENSVLRCVLVTQTAMDKYNEAVNLLMDYVGEDKVYLISNELGNKLSDTKGTQGIFGICKILDKNFSVDTIYSGGKYVVLNNIQDPGNLGTIIRTADALGVSGVILSDDCCDLYNPKVIRSTMGSLFRIPIMTDNINTILQTFKASNITTFAAVIDKSATNLIECDFSKGGVIVIGNEGNGLPPEIVNKCDEKLTIKMQGNVDSLNAAMATGIIMWEMLR